MKWFGGVEGKYEAFDWRNGKITKFQSAFLPINFTNLEAQETFLELLKGPTKCLHLVGWC